MAWQVAAVRSGAISAYAGCAAAPLLLIGGPSCAWWPWCTCPTPRDKTYAGGGGNQCTVRLLGYFRHFVKGFRASSAMAVPSAPSGRTIPQTKYAARFRPYLEKLRMWYQISSLEDELVGR